MPENIEKNVCTGNNYRQKWSEVFPVEEISALVHLYNYAKMAATLHLSDVLQMFYCPITEEENKNLPQALQPDVVAYFDTFTLAQCNFEKWWPRVWRMDVSEIISFSVCKSNKRKVYRFDWKWNQKF